MGAPLVGSPVQANVLTGGGIRFKGLRPKLQSKRLQMICEWFWDRPLQHSSQPASLPASQQARWPSNVLA